MQKVTSTIKVTHIGLTKKEKAILLNCTEVAIHRIATARANKHKTCSFEKKSGKRMLDLLKEFEE